MSQISLLIRINADADEVFEKISTASGIAKWFTDANILKDSETGKMKLQLWQETMFDITEFTPSSRIAWHCVSDDNPWYGTNIVFELVAEQGKTIVIFDHTGWPEITEMYRDCAMSWAYFLESLRSLVEEGVGTPEGVAPKCEASAT